MKNLFKDQSLFINSLFIYILKYKKFFLLSTFFLTIIFFITSLNWRNNYFSSLNVRRDSEFKYNKYFSRCKVDLYFLQLDFDSDKNLKLIFQKRLKYINKDINYPNKNYKNWKKNRIRILKTWGKNPTLNITIIEKNKKINYSLLKIITDNINDYSRNKFEKCVKKNSNYLDITDEIFAKYGTSYTIQNPSTKIINGNSKYFILALIKGFITSKIILLISFIKKNIHKVKL